MTYTEFMTNIEDYYAPYNSDRIKMLILAYIRKKFEEIQLEDVFHKLAIKFTNRYKTPPDIAVFEELFNASEDNLEAQALSAWNKVNKNINSYADIVFEDIRLQATIEDMGGWIAFCQRPNDHKSETWAQKRFVQLYKLYSNEKPLVQHRILKGLSRKLNNALIVIGDKEKCKELMIENNSSMHGKIAGLVEGTFSTVDL